MTRLKVTPVFLPDGVKIRLEWEDGETILATEEFSIAKTREGCAYVSRIAIEQATEQGGTFWLDELGRRHFITVADPGLMSCLT